MGNFQYKTSSGGAWADVPDIATANAGDNCDMSVLYPEAADFDGLGQPCGAVGRPTVRLALDTLRGDGLDWWTDLFTTTSATAVALWLTAYSARHGAWQKFTGYLTRPTWQRVLPGGSQAGTVYYGVQVQLVNCTETT